MVTKHLIRRFSYIYANARNNTQTNFRDRILQTTKDSADRMLQKYESSVYARRLNLSVEIVEVNNDSFEAYLVMEDKNGNKTVS